MLGWMVLGVVSSLTFGVKGAPRGSHEARESTGMEDHESSQVNPPRGVRGASARLADSRRRASCQVWSGSTLGDF